MKILWDSLWIVILRSMWMYTEIPYANHLKAEVITKICWCLRRNKISWGCNYHLKNQNNSAMASSTKTKKLWKNIWINWYRRRKVEALIGTVSKWSRLIGKWVRILLVLDKRSSLFKNQWHLENNRWHRIISTNKKLK